MKKLRGFGIVALYILIIVQCKSGLVTTSNSCYNLITSSNAQNKAGDYTSALANFNEILKKCDAYDARIPAYAGKAGALNGLHQYQEALAAAQEGLKLDKSSIYNLFEKANAEAGLGMNTEAKADLQSVISLTEKKQKYGRKGWNLCKNRRARKPAATIFRGSVQHTVCHWSGSQQCRSLYSSGRYLHIFRKLSECY